MKNFKFENEMDMTSGNIRNKIFEFSIPLMISGVLQLLFSAADLIVCAQFGSANSVGAIAATNALIDLILTVFMGLSVGANAVMGRAYGAKDKEKGDRVLHSSLIISIIGGIIVGALGLSVSKTLLLWMGTPDELLDLANTYLSIYFLGIPAMMVYNFASGCLRGMGDSKRPFYFLLISGILNLGLNYFFVIVFKMDVAGVAVATVITQTLAAAATVICLFYNKGFARLSFKRMRICKNEAWEIIKVGIPAGIQGSMFSLSNVVIQSSVNSFGYWAVTGDGASGSLSGLASVAQSAFSQACLAFTAANYGAKNIPNIKKTVKYSLFYSVVITLLLQLLLVIFARPLASIFTSNQEALDVAVERIYIMSVMDIFFGIGDVLSYADRGLGYSTIPMFVSLITICGLRILYVTTLFNIPQFHTIGWLYAVYPISWVVSAVVHAFAYRILSKKAFVKCMEETKLVANLIK